MGAIDVPPEPDLEDWDFTTLPREVKKGVRREIHWFYWMQQKTYKEISAITGFHRSTIWEDIKWVQANLATTPQSSYSIRQMALMSLRITRAEVIEAARNAQQTEKVGYHNVAKLYEVAAGIDKHVLSRYTPPEALRKPELQPDLEEQLKAMIKYVVHKLGPDALDDFESFFRAHLSLQDSLRKG